jgi:hypothetical protein
MAKPWSEKERRILQKNYYRMNMNELAALLPERSISAIRSQVHYLSKRGRYFEKPRPL